METSGNGPQFKEVGDIGAVRGSPDPAQAATEGLLNADRRSVGSRRGQETRAERELNEVHDAIARTQAWLVNQQHADGYWVAELEGDSILESETIFVLTFLGREDSGLARRCAQHLVDTQLPGGGWTMYPGGDVEISGSVKAYFALKLTGHDVEAEYMVRARRAILEHGGADAVNSYTRFFLAILDQIPYSCCPAVPPEIVLLPKWFPVNLYAVSTWSRTIIVPLSIISALEPVRRLKPRFGIRELFLSDPKDWPPLRCRGANASPEGAKYESPGQRPGEMCRKKDQRPERAKSVPQWLCRPFRASRFAPGSSPGPCPGLPYSAPSELKPSRGEKDCQPLRWERFFRTVDKALKLCQRLRLLPWRRRAIWAATRWMLDRFQQSDGLGAIYPPIVFSLVALRALGYEDNSPEVAYCFGQLQDLILEDRSSGSIRVQPCKSPVWDTAIAVRALAASGIHANDPAVHRALRWLVDRQITRPGDWCETVRAEPGGWCFEFHNDFYPDSDDTAMVLMALAEQFGDDCRERPPWHSGTRRRGIHADPRNATEGVPCSHSRQQVALIARTTAAIDRGLTWLLAMQNDDGGWGAFDRNNNRRYLCYVPFADHNAMIDPSTPDLTARVLEALGKLGRRLGDPMVDRAVAYLRRTQEPDGAWFGRWGVNYIYGTWQTLTGLKAVGVPDDDPAVVAGANWLLAHQQPSGAWGESPDSYDDPRLRGQGPATPSQTAWAVMGLMAAGLRDHPAVAGGIRFLVEQQRSDGTWDEKEFTGTGFPRVFYLRYHCYPIYFPLMALAQWDRNRTAQSPRTSESARTLADPVVGDTARPPVAAL